MKNVTPFPAPRRDRSSDVVPLACPLLLHFDPEPLKQLFQKKDMHIAEETLCRMLEDMALRLDMLQRGLAQSDFAEMRKPARRISFVAKELGLLEVAQSAIHVGTCLDQTDGIAVEAVMARLERSFDVAVSEVWNFRDL